MSEFQQRSKFKKKDDTEKKVSLDSILGDEEPEEIKRPVSKPKPAAKKATAPPAQPSVYIDPAKLLIWAARLKAGSFGQWGNGANFANHMVKDSFKVGGKELSIEEASQMIGKHMNRRP
jgi:hypothetical protein